MEDKVLQKPSGLQGQTGTSEHPAWSPEELSDSWPLSYETVIVGLPGPHPVSQTNKPHI